MKKWPVLQFGVALLALSWAVGCGSSLTTRTALYGDLATLKKEIAAAQERQELDRAATLALAQAVARREVRSASGDAALTRIQQVRQCVAPVRAELEEKAQTRDEPGALATMALMGAGYGDVDSYFETYAGDQLGAWRAIAARAAVKPHHSSARRRMMTDGDERVRQAAFQASLVVRDVDDVDDLLEASRLDPLPINRSTAARAAGAIGGELVVLSLRDRFESAPEEDRMMILDAWGQAGAFRDGGERELLRVAETRGGLLALAAAGLLVQSGDATSRQVASSIFTRAVVDGTREERRMAIRTSPLTDAATIAAIKQSAADADPEVSVMALARLLETKDQRADAAKKLQELTKQKSNIGLQAASALAAARDEFARGILRDQLLAKSSHERQIAALGLLRLGDFSAAATALGDDSPSVRTTVACEILATR